MEYKLRTRSHRNTEESVFEEARKAAKKAKNFAEADAIRDELLAKGITLLDTREGTKFSLS